jgi:hypothetical protein
MTVGSVEWFRHRKRAIIEHARAIDDFRSAVRSFRALVALSPTGEDVEAALHTAGVVNYARPFVGNLTFPLNLLRGNPNFRRDMHDHLITLRNKLVAHSDTEFADGRLFVRKMLIHVGEGSSSELVQGAQVMARAMHAPHDPNLSKAYLAQSEAVAEAAAATINNAMNEYVQATAKFPAAYSEFEKEGPAPRVISEGQFSLSPGSPDAMMPDQMPSPDQLLTLPPLDIGKDGYFYRILSTSIEIEGTLHIRLPDGQYIDLTINRRPKMVDG